MRIATRQTVTSVSLCFDRGTLRLDGPEHFADVCESVVWDDRTGCWRAPAHHYVRVVSRLRLQGFCLVDKVAEQARRDVYSWTVPDLRPYQQDALDAWVAFHRRGVIALPTGSGKTRIALAAMAASRSAALLLCPTRALLAQWKHEIQAWYRGPIGVVGDGECQVENVTVMTFESAYRRLDQMAARFGMVVVDEVHHFANGLRSEALEMCPAPMRLGLTATPPAPCSGGDQQLCALVGPIVFELGVTDLMGTHLARCAFERMLVVLEPEERADYERQSRRFNEMRRALARVNPDADWQTVSRAIRCSRGGRQIVADYHRSVDLATFPSAKRRLVTSLLDRHRENKALVFTAFADHAYAIALDNLVPVITAEVGRPEREEILARFRDGRFRTLVAARVLNEGIDVPDASVAIVVGGTLGTREFRQRIGRVLRPGPGKTAMVYELVTANTIDDDRSKRRSSGLAS